MPERSRDDLSAAYFDTSVLLKRYFAELGSSKAQFLLRRHTLIASAIAPVEGMSAICRRRESGELSEKDFVRISRKFDSDRQRWELVEVNQQVLDKAEEFAERLQVRALDAIHLSSAHLLQAALGGSLRFVTADAKQRTAALALSFECIWVAG